MRFIGMFIFLLQVGLKWMGIDFRNSNFNLSDATRLLHVLFGQKFSTIQNSDFNKLISKAPSVRENVMENIKLLTKLKEEFVLSGLKDIAKMIELDIDKEHNTKKNK